MKKIIFVILLTYSSVICYGQKKKSLFLSLGFGPNGMRSNYSNPSGGFAASAGLETLVYLKLNPSSDIIFNPNLSYLSTTYQAGTSFSSNVDNVKVQYLSLSAPVLVVFGKNFVKKDGAGFFFGAGPFISYALGGKYNTNIAGAGYTKMKFGNSTTDNRTQLDAGYCIKEGFKLGNGSFSLQYNRGLLNVIPKDKIVNGQYLKTKNFQFQVIFGIFNKKRKK